MADMGRDFCLVRKFVFFSLNVSMVTDSENMQQLDILGMTMFVMYAAIFQPRDFTLLLSKV